MHSTHISPFSSPHHSNSQKTRISKFIILFLHFSRMIAGTHSQVAVNIYIIAFILLWLWPYYSWVNKVSRKQSYLFYWHILCNSKWICQFTAITKSDLVCTLFFLVMLHIELIITCSQWKECSNEGQDFMELLTWV